LISAVPVPEIKTDSKLDKVPPPNPWDPIKPIQVLENWICPSCKHSILRDFLVIARMIKRMKKNTKNILSI
jgi:hypothetical protein